MSDRMIGDELSNEKKKALYTEILKKLRTMEECRKELWDIRGKYHNKYPDMWLPYIDSGESPYTISDNINSCLRCLGVCVEQENKDMRVDE